MTSDSKNVYADKLDHTVNKCKYINHSTIKIKPVDVRSCWVYILSLKLVIIIEY